VFLPQRISLDPLQDQNVVKYMASQPNAVDSGRVLVLKEPTETASVAERRGFLTKIDEALANGRFVVVKGPRPQLMQEFTCAALEEAGIIPDQPVSCHGKGFCCLVWTC
jgi:hypothetical protein